MATFKVISLQGIEGPSPGLIHRIFQQRQFYALDAVIPLRIADIAIAEWVHMKCRYGCSRFNTSWCCPPNAPDPDKAKAVLQEYTWALLLRSSKSCPDFYRDNHRKRVTSVRFWKGSVSVERLLFLEGYYKAFALVGESCALCDTCAFPEPCRFPAEHRPSVESFSIDLFATLRNIGKTSEIATSTKDTYSHYSIVLVE